MSALSMHPDIIHHPTSVDALRWHALRTPQARAFVFLENGERETRSLTYAELDRRARTIAQMLRESGFAGKRIVLAYPSGLEFIAALFGCFYARSTAVPAPLLGSKRVFERVRAVSADADAACVLTLASLLSDETHASSTARYIATDEITDTDAPGLSVVDPDGLAVLQYTSGSTGTPRGVMLTHANIVHNQQVLAQALNTRSGDSAVCWLPMYHDMGLIGGVLQSVYVGGFCVLLPPLSFLQRPLRWLEAISKYRATVSMAPCFAYELCARRGVGVGHENLDLSSWRVAICGGEPVRPATVERFSEVFAPAGFRSAAIFPAYGLAEATLLAASNKAERGLVTRAPAKQMTAGEIQQSRLVSRGQAWQGQRIAVVDPESRRRLPDGQQGEIWMQGGSVAAGYWNRPQETADTFQATLADDDAGHWLRTGDLGFIGPEGLFITGRRKELIIIRGVNHDPLALEIAAGDSHPALVPGGGGAFSVDRQDSEAVVLVHEIGRSALKGIDLNHVVTNVAESVTRNFGLTLYDLVFLRPGTLPRTTSGKVQRFACRELYLAGQLASVAAIEHPALGRCRPARN